MKTPKEGEPLQTFSANLLNTIIDIEKDSRFRHWRSNHLPVPAEAGNVIQSEWAFARAAQGKKGNKKAGGFM